MRPLAVLPVFMNLQGRRAVVIGGSAGAAWKAELLAAAGAEVAVFAEDLSEAFAGLLDREPRVGLSGATWRKADFAGAALVVADVESLEEAEVLSRAARAAGAPLNVVDKPEFCDLQFGTIVNRSPVVVGISTDGAAPILGQAIRRRIETLLPPALADWAALARTVRIRVNAVLSPGAERRAFWERFADRAFGPPPQADAEKTLRAEATALRAKAPASGRVTLVGAGPGDAELLTLKAVRALQSADVILFDALVSDDVLELARREARRMLVGKRGGRESCRQEDINDTMVALAKAGKHVVRLKSGDPMVFGRAGEEIARLEAEGIPVAVVPGITSALAMASALGVSLTHRDAAQSIRFVTAHSRKGNLPERLDWQAVADPASTTIFYMGGRMARQIADRLAAEGLSPDTPATIARAVSRPDQALWRGCVAGIAEAMDAIGLDQPVLIGIGAVFAEAAARSHLPMPTARTA